MKARVLDYKKDLRNIREELEEVSKDISDIKELMLKIWTLEDKEKNKMYPIHLPNVTTTMDFNDEEQ